MIADNKIFARILLWLGYFGLLLLASLPHGMRTELTPHYPCATQLVQPGSTCEPKALRPTATNEDIIHVMHGADAAFIAARAKDIVQQRDWTHISVWPLWPPGMVALQTLLYWISPHVPVALILVMINCAVWAMVCTQLAHIMMKDGRQRLLAGIFPLLMLLSGCFDYLLHFGVFFSESFSIAFFLLGIGTLFLSVQDKDLVHAGIAGICFALSAYMRAQTDIIMTLILALMVVYVVWDGLHAKAFSLQRLRALPWLAVTAAAMFFYHIVTFPYRIFHHMHWISFSDNPSWYYIWEKKENLPPAYQFYIQGGGLAGCDVDAELCNAIHARAAAGKGIFTFTDYFWFTLQSFLHHPFAWLVFKIAHLRDFWLDQMPGSLVITILLPVVLFYSAKKRDDRHTILGLFLCMTVAGIIGPLLLMHVELRYLYQLKCLILYSAIIVIGLQLMPHALPPVQSNNSR